MTEKEIPLSSTPYQDQKFKHEPKDEISYLDLLGVLVRKKLLIFITASICVVLSIFYAFSTKTTYRAIIGFQLPFVNENTIGSIVIHPDISVEEGILYIKDRFDFNRFLTEFQSYSNIEKVLIEGNFYEKFVVNNPKTDMKKEITQKIYRSIYVDRTKNKRLINEADYIASYEIKEVKPEVLSDFLNALADLAKIKTEMALKELIEDGIQTQINLFSSRLSIRLNNNHSGEKQIRENTVRILKENIKIAKKLGFLDNKFLDNVRFIERNNLKDSNYPVYYLYGQRALEQELNVIEQRSVSIGYDEKSFALKSKIEKLSGVGLPKINIEPVIISHPSIPPVYPISVPKMKIIAVGVALGLFLGVLIAFLGCLMTQVRERLKHSPPQFM
jgi:LPS O-antigen subunit length determinant protein (WzzB/FepE family)